MGKRLKQIGIMISGIVILFALHFVFVYLAFFIVFSDSFESFVLSKPMSKWESDVMDVYIIDSETIIVEVKKDGEKTLYYATYHGYLDEFVVCPEYISRTDPPREDVYTFKYSAWKNKWRLTPCRGSHIFDEEITLKRRRQELEKEEIPVFKTQKAEYKEWCPA